MSVTHADTGGRPERAVGLRKHPQDGGVTAALPRFKVPATPALPGLCEKMI
jgi:hypothetical protein